MTLTPEERTAGKLAAVHFALRGATIKDLMGSIDPGDGVILVESLTIKTVDGHTLDLAAFAAGSLLSQGAKADDEYVVVPDGAVARFVVTSKDLEVLP